GTISETGTLIAGTLTGSASAASFAGTNSVGTLDGFTTSGDFALNDNEALTALGAVQTGNAPGWHHQPADCTGHCPAIGECAPFALIGDSGAEMVGRPRAKL
ncbi:MAG TPA: hypothetical protein VGH36_10710, partial [Acetobacteraceae bacterium]